jgi:hypothetical protein
MQSYPGVYAGRVVSAADPKQRGRLQLQVPEVLGTSRTDWVEPMLQGSEAPAAGSRVWVFFASGDASRPLWLWKSLTKEETQEPPPDPSTFPGAAQLRGTPVFSIVDAGLTIEKPIPPTSSWWLSSGSEDTGSEAATIAWGTQRGRPVDLALCFNTRGAGWGGFMPSAGQPGLYHSPDIRLMIQTSPFPEGISATYNNLISGGYDSLWVQWANDIKHLDQAAGRKPTIVNIAWEANGSFFPWGYNSGWPDTYSSPAQYKAGFEHISDVLQATYPGIEIGWNMNLHQNPMNSSLILPNPAKLHYIGVDYYDMYPPTHNKAEFTSIANEVNGGVLWYLSIARQYGKKLIVPEWGVVNQPDGNGGGDHPDYVNWMVEVFQNALSTGHMGGETYYWYASSRFDINPATRARYYDVYAIP